MESFYLQRINLLIRTTSRRSITSHWCWILAGPESKWVLSPGTRKSSEFVFRCLNCRTAAQTKLESLRWSLSCGKTRFSEGTRETVQKLGRFIAESRRHEGLSCGSLCLRVFVVKFISPTNHQKAAR